MGVRWRPTKRDEAQPGIVAGLRALGYGVLDVSPLGNMAPGDLVVFRAGRAWVLEVKTPKREKAHKARLERQAAARSAWRWCPCGVVTTLDEALAFVRESESPRA